MANSTSVQKALVWVNEELKNNPDASRAKLISDASAKFDLTPLESEILLKTLQK